jgi:hypothetical protein
VPALPEAAHLARLRTELDGPVHVAELLVAGHAAGVRGRLVGVELGGWAGCLERELEAVPGVLEAHGPAVQRVVDRGLEAREREVLEAAVLAHGHVGARHGGHRAAVGEQHRERGRHAVGRRQGESGDAVHAGRGIGERERHGIGESRPRGGPGPFSRRVGQGASRRCSMSTAVPSTS